MKQEFIPESIGEQLGYNGVDHVTELAGNYAECERRRMEAEYRPEIVENKARLCFLSEKEKDLKERLRLAPPPGDLRTRRRRCVYFVSVAVILAVSGFFFALMAFEPFRFGWKAYVYCAAVAVLAPFTVDKLLDLWGNEKLLKLLAGSAVAAALASLVLLALIRGDILLQQLQALDSTVVIGLDPPADAEGENDFYQQTVLWLRLTMALLALAMEIGAGLALHDAWRYGTNTGDDRQQLAAELDTVHAEMVACVRSITAFQNMPEEFVNRFWGDFYRAMLNGTVRNAITKGVLGLLLCLALSPAPAAADQAVHVVVALDLSRSIVARGADGKSVHERNLDAVARLLSSLPAGARVTVLGITDRSFTHPYVLLSAQVSADAGYFQERLAAARKQLARAWAKAAEHLHADFSRTDVLGALLLAGQIFNQRPGAKNCLVILSDMRHEAHAFNLETPQRVDGARLISIAEGDGLIADLRGVEVHVLGAVAPRRLPSYWESLRLFWVEYFARAGASLKTYSVTHALPRFEWTE